MLTDISALQLGSGIHILPPQKYLQPRYFPVSYTHLDVYKRQIIKRIPMCDMTAEQFRQVIDVDLNAPFILSKAVIPSMIKKGHGKIINICSMMSELGRETVSAYAAAKGGLKMLTRNICSEYGANNIQCNGIGPGYIATPQTAPLREKQADGSRHPFDQFICGRNPAGRWLQAEAPVSYTHLDVYKRQLLYIGIVISIIPKIITDNTGIATANTNAAFTSIVNAIIIAPKTTNGDLNKSLKARFTPF